MHRNKETLQSNLEKLIVKYWRVTGKLPIDLHDKNVMFSLEHSSATGGVFRLYLIDFGEQAHDTKTAMEAKEFVNTVISLIIPV